MRTPLIVLVLAGLAAGLFAQDGTPPASPILVIDLAKIVEECEEGIDLVATLRKKSEVKKKEFATEAKALQEKQQRLLEKGLSARDEAWYKEFRAAVEEESKLKADAAFFNAQINDEIARKMKQLMIQARQEANKVMKERGAFVVLVTKTGEIRFENDTDLQDETMGRRALCFHPDVDITQDVLTSMNEWYKARKKSDG